MLRQYTPEDFQTDSQGIISPMEPSMSAFAFTVLTLAVAGLVSGLMYSLATKIVPATVVIAE